MLLFFLQLGVAGNSMFCFPYQVERKRHIGNDIVIIVFQDWDEKSSSFSPPTIKSKFVRIFYWFYL